MAQQVYEVTDLPSGGIAASAAFLSRHLDSARACLGSHPEDSLAIVLPAASSEERDWRTALARDLARAHAPARVNVVARTDRDKCDALIDYLANAKGVTGQYLETHD